LPSVALSSPPTASPVRAATASVAWLSRAASGTMASTASTNNRIWECGAAVSAYRHGRDEDQHPEQRGVPDFLEQRLYGAYPQTECDAPKSDPVGGQAL